MVKSHTPTQISAVYRKHVLLNAKMTIYNDWLMPEQYLLPDNEIQHSKHNLGLCDISQISKIEISGPNINQILTTISSKAVCNIGEIIDLNIKNNNQTIKIFWCQLSIDKALIISWHNTNEIISLLHTYLKPQTNLINMTFGYTALSLLGPLNTQLLSKLTDINLNANLLPSKNCRAVKLAEIYTILLNFNLKSLSNYILLVETSYGEYLWNTLISLGNEFNIKPLGYSGYNLLNKEIL
tara:strand:- start:38 stop:754 length:717 start_codon:yes stop_codon:yes gene_type:complete